MKSLILFVAFILLMSCAPTPTYVIGGNFRKIEYTEIVFANLDPEYEYLVFVPPIYRKTEGYWVYVPCQKFGSLSRNDIERIKSTQQFGGAAIVQDHTSPVLCLSGLVTFRYLVLHHGRLVNNALSFTFFVVPADNGYARLINLSGRRL